MKRYLAILLVSAALAAPLAASGVAEALSCVAPATIAHLELDAMYVDGVEVTPPAAALPVELLRASFASMIKVPDRADTPTAYAYFESYEEADE